MRELSASSGGTIDAAAMAIGRTKDGKPLAALGKGGGLNDFDFTDDQLGEQTPRFAHIRKMNPRNGTLGRPHPPGATGAGSRSRRPCRSRRGCPARRRRTPTGRSSTVWCSTPSWRASRASSSTCCGAGRATPTRSRRSAADGPDPVIGASDAPCVIRRGEADPVEIHFGRFVWTSGAVYAFAPSLPELRRLAGPDPVESEVKGEVVLTGAPVSCGVIRSTRRSSSATSAASVSSGAGSGGNGGPGGRVTPVRNAWAARYSTIGVRSYRSRYRCAAADRASSAVGSRRQQGLEDQGPLVRLGAPVLELSEVGDRLVRTRSTDHDAQALLEDEGADPEVPLVVGLGDLERFPVQPLGLVEPALLDVEPSPAGAASRRAGTGRRGAGRSRPPGRRAAPPPGHAPGRRPWRPGSPPGRRWWSSRAGPGRSAARRRSTGSPGRSHPRPGTPRPGCRRPRPRSGGNRSPARPRTRAGRARRRAGARRGAGAARPGC